MKRIIYLTRLLTILILMVFLFPYAGFTQLKKTTWSNNQDFVPGTIVIKVKDGIGPFEKQERSIHFGISSLDEKASKFNVNKLAKRFIHKPIPKNSGLPDLSRIYRIVFPKSQNVHEVVKEFAEDPNIEYAEAVPVYLVTDVPDDPLYPYQQHLPQILAAEAWDIHKGEDGDEVIVAIIDTGVDWLHPDLIENCWQNLGEDADGDGVTLEYNDSVWERDPDDLNGIDDDGNGFVDDVIGWDFHGSETLGDGSNPDPVIGGPLYSHGTHCAGIAAGRTNNGAGISSISYNVKYMPIQADSGSFKLVYGLDALIYAADNGTDITSNSWGGRHYTNLGQDVVSYATGLGCIVICAAGNNYNSDLFFPASYHGSISVAALNEDDTRASFSSFGLSVDIAAPGVGILSTIPNNNYSLMSGTSMATPMVSGLFALLKSYRATWTTDQLIEQIIGTTDNIDAINPGFEKALGSGRVNAFNTLANTNVEVLQELRLELLDFIVEDEDGDSIIEAGETASVSISMRNFAHLVSDENALFTLSSVDPDIIVTTGLVTEGIPADSVFEINDAFEFNVAESAEPHISDFIIEISSNMPVIYGSETEISIFVAPSGFFVWEGDPNVPDYSGAFIKDYLEARGHDVYYSNHYPQSFIGFDAVFLSFSNWEAGGTSMDNQRADAIIDYLEAGGSVYLEGGDVLGWDQTDNSQLLDLFGLKSTSDGTINPIDKLEGQPDALTNEMVFTDNSQFSNNWIDIYEPSTNGITAFTESDYGPVAVQHDGTGGNGQKTFCMSYALVELEDGDGLNTRDELLKRILNFFNVLGGVEEQAIEESIEKLKVSPNPSSTQITIELHNTQKKNAEFTLYNMNSQQLLKRWITEQKTVVDISGLPKGIYFVKVVDERTMMVGKMVKE